METKRMDGKPVNGARRLLREVIPLPSPYSITVFPIYACNFKCRYCMQSLPPEERRNTCTETLMTMEIYRKFVDELTEMGGTKAFHFAGYGEPLLHPDIIEMVRYAKEKGVAGAVDLVTNGVLLTEKMIHGLVDARLDRLRISLQGLDAARYEEMCDAKIDFEKFLETLAYLYEHRGSMKVYLKILDVELKGHSEEEFILMFGAYADEIAVEHLVPIATEIDYAKEFQQESFDSTMGGVAVQEAEICPQAFYFLQINPDGDLLPCCMSEKPIVAGNILRRHLRDIWEGAILQEFRRKQLQRRKHEYPVCKKCTQYRYGLWPEDCIDDVAEELLQRCFGV